MADKSRMLDNYEKCIRCKKALVKKVFAKNNYKPIYAACSSGRRLKPPKTGVVGRLQKQRNTKV